MEKVRGGDEMEKVRVGDEMEKVRGGDEMENMRGGDEMENMRGGDEMEKDELFMANTRAARFGWLCRKFLRTVSFADHREDTPPGNGLHESEVSETPLLMSRHANQTVRAHGGHMLQRNGSKGGE
ncbi:unnamed protein product [Lota lota]